MFATVMSDPEICHKVLELAWGILISEVHIQAEKTMVYYSEYHGVRLDVYVAVFCLCEKHRVNGRDFNYRFICRTSVGQH